MYLRHTTRHKDGKIHVYWQLVRSVRHGGKVVQETVAQLGELDGEGRARAKALARSIRGREEEQRQLFEGGEPAKALAVKLDEIGWSVPAVLVRCGWGGCCGARSGSMSC